MGLVGVGVSVGRRENGDLVVLENFVALNISRTEDPDVLHVGDVITAIDDRAVIGNTVAELGELLQGPAGSHVRVEVLRNSEPVVLRISREPEAGVNLGSEVVDAAVEERERTRKLKTATKSLADAMLKLRAASGQFDASSHLPDVRASTLQEAAQAVASFNLMDRHEDLSRTSRALDHEVASIRAHHLACGGAEVEELKTTVGLLERELEVVHHGDCDQHASSSCHESCAANLSATIAEVHDDVKAKELNLAPHKIRHDELDSTLEQVKRLEADAATELVAMHGAHILLTSGRPLDDKISSITQHLEVLRAASRAANSAL